MKRFLLLFTLLLSACLLSACGKEAEQVCHACNEMCSESASFCPNCGAIMNIDLPIEDQAYEEEIVDYTILDSGYCNQNVSWEIRSDGTLYIDGNGTVPMYESREVDGEIAPWRDSAVCSEITDVVISDKVTGVGEHAFHKMRLSSICFGHNVIAYDWSSSGSIAVGTVYIPLSMKDIEDFLTDSWHDGSNMTVYYEGAKEDWDRIVDDSKGWFSNYDIHYNYEY